MAMYEVYSDSITSLTTRSFLASLFSSNCKEITESRAAAFPHRAICDSTHMCGLE